MTVATANFANAANADAAARFIASAPGRNDPTEAVDAARMVLVDTLGVALGAADEDAGRIVRKVAVAWNSSGGAQILLGGRSAPAIAALINATHGHCLDYDDTHVGAVAHLGNPTWAAALAIGQHIGACDRDILNAAAAAAATLLGLDESGIRNALGAAATQAAGLTASFGTMSKPFHAGKAAMNGVLAAELAAAGFDAADGLLEPEGGFGDAYVQDRATVIQSLGSNLDSQTIAVKAISVPTPRVASSQPMSVSGNPRRCCSIGGNRTIGVKLSMPKIRMNSMPKA